MMLLYIVGAINAWIVIQLIGTAIFEEIKRKRMAQGRFDRFL